MNPFFSYHLPANRIAQYPPSKRGAGRLLVVNRRLQTLTTDSYSNFHRYLDPHDLLVINDTKVFKARIFCTTDSGAHIELFLLEDHHHRISGHACAIYHGRLKPGKNIYLPPYSIHVKSINSDGIANLHANADFHDIAQDYGTIPIPPYLNRLSNTIDHVRYQTKFASQIGSVAAPTASLNLTLSHLSLLKKIGFTIQPITLHVGIGTFKPVRTQNPLEHHIHSESYLIPLDTAYSIQQTQKRNHRIVALGTTVARALEHAAPQLSSSISSVLVSEANNFIYPPYDMKIITALLTNFHTPRSTLLLLVASFMGWPLLEKSYRFALQHNFKFLSYGDSMLII